VTGSDASLEYLLSLANILWPDERNCLLLDMIKSVLIVKTHYKCALCSGLFDLSEELTGINWCKRKMVQHIVCGSVLKVQLNQGENRIVKFGRGVQVGCCL
jgi:hypothetical protein